MSTSTPNPATDRPLRADARRNREAILEAAQVEFARSGGDAQVDAIAARAGLGVGTLYRHFPTKEALVTQLLRVRFERLVATAETALEIEDPWSAFATYMRASAAECAQDVGTQWIFQQADPDLGPRLAEETGLLDRAQLLIDRGQAAGVIRPDFAALDVGMVMCGVAAAMHHGPQAWDWQRHLDFVLDGLRAQPVQSRA